MPDLLLLVGDQARASNDNHQRFCRAFEAAGWSVATHDHDALEVRRNQAEVAGRHPASFDLIWPLGFGRQTSFFDRMQILRNVDGVQYVTSPDVLVYLHGKHRWLELMPETYTSVRPDTLFEVISSGGDWVLKPSAGSFGRDVHFLNAASTSLADIEAISRRLDGAYLIAQRFVPEVRQGEKRTLIAGGEIVGSYLRVPAATGTANLAAGGIPKSSQLTGQELELIEPIARQLAELGAGFAAIDTVFPYLMEINVANPGGLETLEDLDGTDLSHRAVSAILRWQERCAR